MFVAVSFLLLVLTTGAATMGAQPMTSERQPSWWPTTAGSIADTILRS